MWSPYVHLAIQQAALIKCIKGILKILFVWQRFHNVPAVYKWTTLMKDKHCIGILCQASIKTHYVTNRSYMWEFRRHMGMWEGSNVEEMHQNCVFLFQIPQNLTARSKTYGRNWSKALDLLSKHRLLIANRQQFDIKATETICFSEKPTSPPLISHPINKRALQETLLHNTWRDTASPIFIDLWKKHEECLMNTLLH